MKMQDNNLYSLLYINSTDSFLKFTEPKRAYVYYKNHRINLLSLDKEPSSIKRLFSVYEKYQLNQSNQNPSIFHLTYDLGKVFNELGESIDSETPLAINIEYECSKSIPRLELINKSPMLNLKAGKRISKKQYEEGFHKVYRHLYQGDCYQVNLTMPFEYSFSKKTKHEDFLNSLFQDKTKIGAYAHVTYIPSIDKLILSNSPECLFQISLDNKQVYTMPIKGTASIDDFGTRAKAWRFLYDSKKEKAELYMIADLLRNDLTKIKLHPATIKFKRLPLNVSGLVHQYSLIASKHEERTTLLDILKGVFPGGSITGAPKIKVMKIIDNVELRDRGHYCGSTVVLYKNLQAASINIRTAEVSLGSQPVLQYGAGGGITILSEASSEYNESYSKLESFINLINN